MLHRLMEWGSSYPSVRRPLIRLWRRWERARRATLTNAVLVVRNGEGRVLVLRSPSGALRLPISRLHAGDAATTQVEQWLQHLLHQNTTPTLVAIDGTPSQGVTFVYWATGDVDTASGDGLWLEPEMAASCLENDSRLLRLYLNSQESGNPR